MQAGASPVQTADMCRQIPPRGSLKFAGSSTDMHHHLTMLSQSSAKMALGRGDPGRPRVLGTQDTGLFAAVARLKSEHGEAWLEHRLQENLTAFSRAFPGRGAALQGRDRRLRASLVVGVKVHPPPFPPPLHPLSSLPLNPYLISHPESLHINGLHLADKHRIASIANGRFTFRNAEAARSPDVDGACEAPEGSLRSSQPVQDVIP